MCSNKEILSHILENCEVQVKGQTISKEQLLKTFGDFVAQTITKREHNIGLIMHTGSICFDALLIVYATVMNLITNKTDTNDMINSLSDGDTVLYGETKKSRFVFRGFVDGSNIGDEKGKPYIKLVQEQSNTRYVPPKKWRYIEPYNGNSVRMDGRGIRKKTSVRDKFFTEVLGIKQENIPSLLDTSCVIVTSRDYADCLVKNISLLFNNKKISLLELITASYFSEEGEYRYGGNTGKNEPVLKFTARISTARSLILSRKGNRHSGLIVLGGNSVLKGYTELPELINRQSLSYIYLCTSMDNDLGLKLTSDIEEAEIFACTKEFLLENTMPDTVEHNNLIIELADQINNIIDKENQLLILEETGITTQIFLEFKKNILKIKRDEFMTNEKDNFIMLAYSLMKLFITAPFPMNRFLVARDKGIIEVETPNEKIEKLEKLSAELPEYLRKKATVIINILKDILKQEESNTGKYEWFRNYLYTHARERAAIVVPKAYYITLIKKTGLFSEHLFNNKFFFTANRFDNSRTYECVIVLGDYEGKSFNTFRCNEAPTLISVLYESEKDGYIFKKKIFEKDINYLQRRSTIALLELEKDEIIIPEERDTDSFEKEMQDYLSKVDLSYFHTEYKNNTEGYETTINTDIVAIAVFDDDTKAYFSKHYKGYVLDEMMGDVREVDVQEFNEGDSVVFTKNNDETKDIVSSILTKLFLEGRLDTALEDSYRKSNLWKKSLIDFMHDNQYTARKVAELMHKDGATVHEQTILHWLDEGSHTVGPRHVDSIRHIGNITGIAELKDSPEDVFESCKEIRAIRRKILMQIGTVINEKLSGRIPKPGSDMEFVFDKVETLSEIKRIERIVRVESAVPMGIANRPISI